MKVLFFILLLTIGIKGFSQEYKVGDKFFSLRNFVRSNGDTIKSKNKGWVVDSVFIWGRIPANGPIPHGAMLITIPNKDTLECSPYEIAENLLKRNIIWLSDYNYFLKKYGKPSLYKIANGDIWVGMTTEQAKFSIGEPVDINTTVTKKIIHEQYVYDGLGLYKYLYFVNNKLISYQF